MAVEGQKNLYGVHPFYLCVEKDQKSHAVLLLNSNAMEATLMPAPAISFRTIGGVLDFFLIVGDNPEHVIQLYTSLVGRPRMPPYWALGFQLSRYGYDNMENLKRAINRTRSAGIIQEVQYLDIDHFEGNKDFTYDKERFKDLPEFITDTKKQYGLKWIIILDPAIPAATNYDVYEEGIKKKVYVERSPPWSKEMFPEHVRNETAVYGKVWPADVVAFPNFFRDETADWWTESIVKYHDTLAFDGLWIDMNEPASFETNSDHPFYCESSWDPPPEECWSLKCPTSALEDPPYNPLKSSGTTRLSTMTLCMESQHAVNSDTSFKHYDVHSLYGWSQSIPTIKAAVQATGTRSVVISRSTFPSSGQFAGHWLGDNRSIWPDLHRSIIGMLEFNLFGIPYIGADVCGFNGDTTPEMCKRWMQLGAFYPFFRNHNGKDQREQDPLALGPDVAAASKDAVDRRIRLNPYLYTLFYRAHMDGSTVVRPVFHEFPEDEIALSLDTQFMWGCSLLITPILKEGAKSVPVYLPNDEWWYFLYEESVKEPVSSTYVSKSSTEKHIPLHVRGGTVLPIGTKVHGPESKELSNSHIQLYVFPKNGRAKGELFVDDGISNENIEKRPYFIFTFDYQNCSLTIDSIINHSVLVSPTLDSIVVFGVGNIANVYSEHQVLKFYMDDEKKIMTAYVESSMTSIESITWSNAIGECDMQ
ncbi:probable maltase-glucoamylase 2 [Uloborus diversus]|uniref:probable maltase-glucoamylase 2 n=1 Tax=Uloborus diversus TaxID=327109 RepID=UPI00240920C7|nr:probable maltase-glucoamylase 2 [Uloborus diversus]